MHHIGRFGIESSSVISDDVIISPSATLQGINYMENKSYEEYFSGLTPQQQKMIKQGLASIKEWGENVYEFVSEVENDDDGQKKYRNNTKQKQAMKNKQIAARRKKNKIKHK